MDCVEPCLPCASVSVETRTLAVFRGRSLCVSGLLAASETTQVGVWGLGLYNTIQAQAEKGYYSALNNRIRIIRTPK